MKFLLDEKALLEKTLKDRGISEDKPTYSFRVLIKHFFLQHSRLRKEGKINRISAKKYVLDEMEKFLYKNQKHNFVKSQKTINKMINWIFKVNESLPEEKKYKLVAINRLGIPKSDLMKIRQLDDCELEKYAFSILVTTRLKNLLRVNGNKSDVFDDNTELIKDAQLLPESKKRAKLMLFELNSKGMIQPPFKNTDTKCKALFISEDTDEEIVVKDFDNLVLYYLMWRGDKKIKECEKDCGKIFIKNNNKHKFCTECADTSKKEKDRVRMEENRFINSRK